MMIGCVMMIVLMVIYDYLSMHTVPFSTGRQESVELPEWSPMETTTSTGPGPLPTWYVCIMLTYITLPSSACLVVSFLYVYTA